MLEKQYTITSETGLHARPASLMVTGVNRFESEVSLEYRGRKVNLKSMIGILSLGVPKGAAVKVVVDGIDEGQVIETLDQLMLEEGLGV